MRLGLVREGDLRHRSVHFQGQLWLPFGVVNKGMHNPIKPNLPLAVDHCLVLSTKTLEIIRLIKLD